MTILRRPIVAVIRAIDRARGLPACRGCGCTDHAACTPRCWWVGPDLCSECEWEGLG